MARAWIAKQVGPTGTVVGGDISRDQLAYARAQGAHSDASRPPQLVELNAYDTGLPAASFDMVHCRLLLCHLERPADALREIHRLLKPGGVLVCQDLELSTLFSRSPSKAYEQSVALGHAMGKMLGVNYDFGTQLRSAVMRAGFGLPTVRFVQPIHMRGLGKDWWRQTFEEVTPVMIRLGLITQDEISILLSELKELALDEQVLLAQVRMPAVSRLSKEEQVPGRSVSASCCESVGFAIFSLHMKIFLFGVMAGLCAMPVGAQLAERSHVVVLRAARMLDVAGGRIVAPGEVLVEGDRIVAAGAHVDRPAGAEVIDLGDTTLMPGMIDAHVHLFLHVGAEDLQTVQESVPERTLIAAGAAKADLMAGFTAERDMGSEGAGCADVAVRNAINKGAIPGPRMRMSCNAIDLTGGHEDAIGYNPAQKVFSNADYADTEDEVVKVMREQRKIGADFTKIYETGQDSYRDGVFKSPYQYTEAELAAAVKEAERTGGGVGSGRGVAVHATGEPGTGYAVAAGVASIDHGYQLSDATMKAMKEKQIYAVPTFAIAEYFADHAATPERAARGKAEQAYHAAEFKKQLAAGVPMAMGSDVGPFPHGTQARELELMVQYGMKPAAALQADMLNGAKLLGWGGEIGELKAGYFADVIAVPGNPLEDISATTKVGFVMKGGVVYKR